MKISPRFTPATLLSRRPALAAGAVLIAAPWFITSALAQESRRATPSQTEGPYYPVLIPADSDADLLANGNLRYTPSQPLWLEGSVTDLAGRPLRGALVEIWQCDENGHYHHPGDGARADPAFQGFGRSSVNKDGEYRFRTLRPARYEGRTPHIHVKVKLAQRSLLTTQMYVEGDTHNEADFLWRRLSAPDRSALTRPVVASAQGPKARFDIAVAA